MSIKTFLLNLFFWPLFALVTFLGIPFLTLWLVVRTLLSSHRTRMRMFRRMIVCYGRMVMACLFPFVRVIPETPIEQIPEGGIYICNHRSSSDPFFMAFLPGELVQVVNIWPFHIPILGWFAKWAGYLSVREMPFDAFLEQTSRYLEQGTGIAAFPEGTRSGIGPMGPFHGALFRVALATGVPVVPVCISGTEQIPPKGSLCLHPGTIRIRALPAIYKETYRDWSPFRFKTHVHHLIEAELERMEGAVS